MNEKEEINFEDWFKDVETINEIPPIPKDFKNFFKNVKTIIELPPIPEGLDTKHLQEFIDEFDDTKKHDKTVRMSDMYGITYEQIKEAKEKYGWEVVDMFLEEPKDSDIK